MRVGKSFAALPLLILAMLPSVSIAQNERTLPPDYRGVNVQPGGIFVTPVSGAPFSATVDIISRQKLGDGTTNIRTTIAHVARDSSGRIYNERRQMVSTGFTGQPPLLSSHIYDPGTHVSTLLNPYTRVARQFVLKQVQVPSPDYVPVLGPHAGAQLAKEEQLGEQAIGNTELRGVRKTWTVPATASGTGAPLSIIDEYWYSPDLSVYLIIKHDDPRTGEQIVAVTEVDRREPDASRFIVPAGFKVVDETPVE